MQDAARLLGGVRIRLPLYDRSLGLDDLVYHPFAQTEPASDVGGTHTHFPQLEDLLLLDFCETKNRLNHRGRSFCTALRKLPTDFSNIEPGE